jgi:hypothetical protein
MQHVGAALVAASLLFAFGCARSIPEEVKAEMAKPVDCSTAEQDIATLEAEKASAAEQVSAGARSVVPIAAVAGLLRGDTKDRAAVASGKYNEQLEAKIAEIKQKCGLRP